MVVPTGQPATAPTTAGTKFIVTTTSRSHVHALNPMAGNFNGGLRCPSKDREAFEREDNRWSRRRAAVRGPSHCQRYAIRDNRIRRTLGSLIVAAEDERSRCTEAVQKDYRAICLRRLFMILGFAGSISLSVNSRDTLSQVLPSTTNALTGGPLQFSFHLFINFNLQCTGWSIS